MSNKKIDNLIAKCSNLVLFDGRVLISPLKLKTKKKVIFEPQPVLGDDGKQKMTDDGVPEMMMQEVNKVVPEDMQYAVVLQKALDEGRFDIGDTIIYRYGSISDYTLVRGASLIRKYDIIGVVA